MNENSKIEKILITCKKPKPDDIHGNGGSLAECHICNKQIWINDSTLMEIINQMPDIEIDLVKTICISCTVKHMKQHAEETGFAGDQNKEALLKFLEQHGEE